jgi:TolB-like protein/DNA-binding winged helix-turn-helix (wHTH) protein/Tfp pilus assembly protein PilF
MSLSPSQPPSVRFGPFEASFGSRELRKHGVRVRLPGQPFDILAILLEHAGEVVTREELRRRLWRADTFVDFDHGMNNAVKKLRAALGDSADAPRFVETLPRQGYRFIGTVDIEAAKAPKPLVEHIQNASPPNTDEAAPAIPRSRVRRIYVWASLTVLTLAVLVGLSVRTVRDHLLGRTNLPPIRALAVLPLENLSSDPAQDFFADGMTEELTTDLGKISALRVISRTSVMQYKGTKKSLSKIGRELGVDAVIEGTVTRSGNHVRITANLIQVSPERHLWAESYDSDLGDILVLKEELAQAIATAIQLDLTPEERTRLAGARPVDPEAYQAYLKGEYFFAKFTHEGRQKALTYFQEAVQKDPNLVLAYVGISNVYQILGNLEFVLPSVAHPQGKLAIAKALEIDTHSGEAHAALAWRLLYYDWDFAASEKEFKYALQLNPNAAATHQGYAKYFAALGRFPESVAEMKRALDLDPLSLNKLSDFCRVLFYARRYDEALTQCNAALEIDPNYGEALFMTGDVYAAMGKNSEAHRLYAKAETLWGENPATIAAMDRAFAKSGLWGEAQTWIEWNKKQIEGGKIPPIYMALLYSDCGRKDEAFAWLEKAYERRSHYMIFVAVDPAFDLLHADPRFADLLRRIGLSPALAWPPPLRSAGCGRIYSW